MKKLELYKPLHPFTITQGFGICTPSVCQLYKSYGLNGHNGLDCIRGWVSGKYYEVEGSNVRAAHDGLVTYAGMDSSGGYGVVVQTTGQYLDKDGKPQFWKSIYWHLQPNILARVGQMVRIGDILGYADNTGASTASHLHFGLKPIAQGETEWAWDNVEQNNGYKGAVDPLPYLKPQSAYEVMSSLQNLVEMVKKIMVSVGLR